MQRDQHPPLYVWFVALALVGAALLVSFLLLEDPLRYLAQQIVHTTGAQPS